MLSIVPEIKEMLKTVIMNFQISKESQFSIDEYSTKFYIVITIYHNFIIRIINL